MLKGDSERIRIRSAVEAGQDMVPLKDARPRSAARVLIMLAGGVLIFMALWYLVAEIYNNYLMYSLRFPTPAAVFQRLGDLFFTDMKIAGKSIYVHLEWSIKRWVAGFMIGFLVGFTIGILLSISDKLYDILMVPLSIWQMVPSLAWIPVTILLFGFGNMAAIFIISATVLAPIAINVCNGIKRVPPVYKRLSLMAEKPWGIRMIRVMVPYASLDIVTGLRIGMANGWRTLISAEMVVGVSMGLGYTISAATNMSNYVTAFCALVLICVIGLIIDRLILANIEKMVRKKMGLEEQCCQ